MRCVLWWYVHIGRVVWDEVPRPATGRRGRNMCIHAHRRNMSIHAHLRRGQNMCIHAHWRRGRNMCIHAHGQEHVYTCTPRGQNMSIYAHLEVRICLYIHTCCWLVLRRFIRSCRLYCLPPTFTCCVSDFQCPERHLVVSGRASYWVWHGILCGLDLPLLEMIRLLYPITFS